MSGFPKFLGPYTTGSEIAMEVYFTCTVQYMRQSGDTDARFRVTFLFDGQTIENVKFMKHSNKSFEALPKFYLTTENSSTPVVLGENYLRGRLGREVSVLHPSNLETKSVVILATSGRILKKVRTFF